MPGKTDEAIEQFRKGLSLIKPHYPEAHNNLAIALAAAGAKTRRSSNTAGA